MDFSKGEEGMMEAQVKAIKEAGANVVVTGGKVADMALHYANKYKLMVVRWDENNLGTNYKCSVFVWRVQVLLYFTFL